MSEPKPATSRLRLPRGPLGWFLTAFLVLVLAAIALVIYAVKVRSMEFLYVLF